MERIRYIYTLLIQHQKKRFFLAQSIIVLISIMESASLFLFWFFVGIMTDVNSLANNRYLRLVYDTFGFFDRFTFNIYFSVFLVLIFVMNTVFSITGSYITTRYINSLMAHWRDRLYRYYLYQSWLFHVENNTAQLIRKITVDMDSILSNVLSPIMRLNAAIVLAIGMICALTLINPLVILINTVILTIIYCFIYKLSHFKLSKNGKVLVDNIILRQRLLGESLNGIKDILLSNKQQEFYKQSIQCNRHIANSSSKNTIISLAPKYIIELLLVTMAVAITVYTFGIVGGERSLSTLIPLISAYAFAALKLLPTVQQIYALLSQLKASVQVLDNISDDLSNCLRHEPKLPQQKEIDFTDRLQVNGISFSFPNSKTPTLTGVDIVIPRNKSIAFIGESGAGKSTLLHIILGLLFPDTGKYLVDQTLITEDNVSNWQKKIGYVSQEVFLLDGTIVENIAFGIASEKVDINKVNQVLLQAQLDKLLATLPEGVNTKLGQYGIKLSGGQRQRIAIARALYHDIEVLILDEATNALDGITEKAIVETLVSFADKKTIVMVAHRLNTIKHCDIIYIMEKGKVVDSGTYETLLSKSSVFQRMAKVS